jgi:hypothetical protein
LSKENRALVARFQALHPKRTQPVAEAPKSAGKAPAPPSASEVREQLRAKILKAAPAITAAQNAHRSEERSAQLKTAAAYLYMFVRSEIRPMEAASSCMRRRSLRGAVSSASSYPRIA